MRTKFAREYLHYWTMFANQKMLGYFAVNRTLPKHLISFKFTFPPANSFTYKLGRFGLESCWNSSTLCFFSWWLPEVPTNPCSCVILWAHQELKIPTKALHELLATISKKYVAEDPQLEFKVLVMLLKYYFAIQMATHLHTVKKHFFSL